MWAVWPARASRGGGGRPGRQGVRAVGQRLAAQPGGDTGGLAGRGRGGRGVAESSQVGGVVEQPVSEVVGGGVLAQPVDRVGERRAGGRVATGGGRVATGGGRVATGGGQAGAGQVAFGALHRGQLPGAVAVQHRQQLGGGSGVGEVVCGAGGQRPGPPQVLGADPQDVGVGQGGAGEAQRVGRLPERGGGERLHRRDERLVLGVFAGSQAAQPGQDRLGGGAIAAQRRQPGPVAGQALDVGQPVGVGGLGQLGPAASQSPVISSAWT